MPRVGICIVPFFRIKCLATQIVFGVMVPIRAGPIISALNKWLNYLVNISSRVKCEGVFASDKIAVQNDKIWSFLCEDLTHQRSGILVRWDAECAFIFTIMKI